MPPLRKLVWERASSLSINPDFRRRPPEGDFARMVFWQELGASLWAWALLASLVWLGWRPSADRTGGGFGNGRASIRFAPWWRTCGRTTGEAMTVTAQYLDSVNVPPPELFAPLWAPVGLRYHALHHLLPSLPYHSLGEAHRRLAGSWRANSTYQEPIIRACCRWSARIARSTMMRR